MLSQNDFSDIYWWTAFISGGLFAAGAIFLKQALVRGCGLWQTNFFSNLAIGAVCVPLWFFVKSDILKGSWEWAVYAGLAFFIGQIFVFSAFLRTAISITTPLIGTKVLWVVLLSVDLFGQVMPARWWWAAGLVPLAIFLITGIQPLQEGNLRDVCLGACFAVVAAISFASSDVLLVHAAREIGGLGAVAIAYSEVGLLTFAIYPAIFGKKIWIVSRHQGLKWLILGLGFLTIEAVMLRLAIGGSQNATVINILYSARCLWGVLLTWWLARFLDLPESNTKTSIMLFRILGAMLLTIAILIVLV